ncbi:hypothetical protein ACHAXR_001952 [Thalassiosira sp. AJA248-18]
MSADDVSQCAACGEGGDNLKTCTACKLVKYCNVTCQKAHRPKHKTVCKKRASELFDEALFKQPPPKDDCPICFLPLPLASSEMRYKTCCGKIICSGCGHADALARAPAEPICPFCRTPAATSVEGAIKRIEKRVEAGDTNAMRTLGFRYLRGDGLPQDFNKAWELWHQAVKLGGITTHCDIGSLYFNGEGVEKDVKKAKYHCELGAMGGDRIARYNLGIVERDKGNMNRAMKHFVISAGFGDDESLEKIKDAFSDGHVTKDDFEKALRAHKEAEDEMQSDQRDTARRWKLLHGQKS